MALRDQPYLPLYVQDIMTDEKLNECSAATHGIYIKGIMCLMHKSEEYGKILLKQKDKQTTDQIKNFAVKLEKHLPYSSEEIERALVELLTEKVLYIEGDALCQKRMIRDNAISELRSKAGRKGAEQKGVFAKAKAYANDKAKNKANTEYEYEYEYENENENRNEDELKNQNGVRENVPREPMSSESKTEVKHDFTKPDVEGDDLVFPIDTEPVRELWARWKQYRWEQYRARYGIYGEQADLKRLQGMNFKQIEQTILSAIANNWKNLYPDNGRSNSSSVNKKQQESDSKAEYLTDYYSQKLGKNKAKPGVPGA